MTKKIIIIQHDGFDEGQPPKHPKHHYEGEAWRQGGSPKRKTHEVKEESDRLDKEPHRFRAPPKKQRRMSENSIEHRRHTDEEDLIENHSKDRFRKSLGIPRGQRLPDSVFEKEKHTKNAKLRRSGDLAQILRGFHHKG